MKTVTSGENYTTITVDTAEAVKFSFPSTSLSVEVLSGEITVALTATAQAGDDGTITIPEGETQMFIHNRMNVDTYYLIGSGKAVLHASNMGNVNPFKGKAKGGDGGGDNTHYKGTTTTALENGSTTNPITIDGESYTAVFGDVVVYGYTEFVFDGTQWSEFGRPFDTVPTQGSTNAVTSDGIYAVTPWRRGTGSDSAEIGNAGSHATGSHSVAIGSDSKAKSLDSFAAGYYAAAEAPYASALGFNLHAKGHYSHVIGKNNNYGNNDLFEIGNGSDINHRSNLVEANNSRFNVNCDLQVNHVSVPTPYTTMPTIAADMLGKVVQYVGASDSNYNQGWNYVAISDGAETPTYSWQALMDTTPTSGSTNAVTSDGVYRNTPLVQDSVTATGYKRRNANGTARGANSWSLGTGTVATNANQTAIGTYNGATMSDSLFVVGNGTANDSAHRSNILDVSRTNMNVNGDIKINNVSIPIPYTAMPTITESMLGKIVMYVGATGNGYTQGCFYIASTDGAAEPTYSWVKIGGGRTEVVLWENTGTTNPDTITLSEAWSNFDELVIVTDWIENSTHTLGYNTIQNTYNIGDMLRLWYYDNTVYGTYAVTSSTVLTRYAIDGSNWLSKIIGIKY